MCEGMEPKVSVPKGEEEPCGVGNDHLRLSLGAQILRWEPHTLLAHTNPGDLPCLGFSFFSSIAFYF